MGAMKREAVNRSDRALQPPRLTHLLDRGLDVFCWCNKCGHNAVMPTADLADRLGPQLSVPEVGARMRCSVCRSKNIATRPAWPRRGTITRHHEQKGSADASPIRDGKDDAA